MTEGTIRRLTDRFFRGSIEQLVSRLVKKDLTTEELDRIQKLLDDHRREQDKK